VSPKTENAKLTNAVKQGWGPRGLALTSRTARGQNFAALASKTPGLGLEDPWPWPRQCTASVLRFVGKTLNLWVVNK